MGQLGGQVLVTHPGVGHRQKREDRHRLFDRFERVDRSLGVVLGQGDQSRSNGSSLFIGPHNPQHVEDFARSVSFGPAQAEKSNLSEKFYGLCIQFYRHGLSPNQLCHLCCTVTSGDHYRLIHRPKVRFL